ncbi:MAG TPA: hypothetical protein VFX44_11675 [Solirubrobacterales bacterium]|nr:hypothetical protein [Solirubrobacterales bacterium]
MPSIKKTLARRAVKTTARHTAHGTASKLKRDPVRAATLLGLGGIAGAVVGWIAGRSAAPGEASTGISGAGGPS